MLTCLRGDGSYPFDHYGKWEHVLKLSEDVATKLLGDHTITNKEFRVIPHSDYDIDYIRWDTGGREWKEIGNREYYPRALAVYKHDFTWWLIRRVS